VVGSDVIMDKFMELLSVLDAPSAGNVFDILMGRQLARALQDPVKRQQLAKICKPVHNSTATPSALRKLITTKMVIPTDGPIYINLKDEKIRLQEYFLHHVSELSSYLHVFFPQHLEGPDCVIFVPCEGNTWTYIALQNKLYHKQLTPSQYIPAVDCTIVDHSYCTLPAMVSFHPSALRIVCLFPQRKNKDLVTLTCPSGRQDGWIELDQTTLSLLMKVEHVECLRKLKNIDDREG
jgi:hypothetical protein